MMAIGVLCACIGATLSLGEKLTGRTKDNIILWLSLTGGCLCFSVMACAILIVTEVIK